MRSLLVATVLAIAPWGPACGADAVAAFGIEPAAVSQLAPDFRLARLGGGEASLADFKGRLVLVNFWATWCEPCRREMPALERLARRYRDRGFTVLAINEDADDGARAARFVARHALTYPVLLDGDGAVARRYGAKALPMSYLIGADGNLIGTVVGARDWEGRPAELLIEQHLPQRR